MPPAVAVKGATLRLLTRIGERLGIDPRADIADVTLTTETDIERLASALPDSGVDPEGPRPLITTPPGGRDLAPPSRP
jgi:hypothetical protein